METAKQEISSQLSSLTSRSSPIVDSPISTAIDLQALRQSSDPEQRSIGDLVEGFSELKQMVSFVLTRIDDVPRDRHYMMMMERSRDMSRDLQEVLVRSENLVSKISTLIAPANSETEFTVHSKDRWAEIQRVSVELQVNLTRAGEMAGYLSDLPMMSRRRVVK